MRRYSFRNGLLWLIFFFVLALLPILIAYAGELPPYRTFLEEFGVALGFIGLSLFGLQFLFTGRIKEIAPAFGVDNIVQFHKELGVIAILFALAHPATMLVADLDYLSFYDPRENLPRALALVAATIGMVLLLVTSLWRVAFGLSYEWWRLIHGILGFLVIFVGIVHSIQVGHYLDSMIKIVPFTLLFVGFLYLLIHTRLVRPYRNLKKPYYIKEVLERRDDCYTLVLEPEDHTIMTFEPGQFIWITIQSSPFSLQQHPFSFSSSSLGPTLSITAKALGDFTSTWEDLKPGQKAFIEGPFGSFTLKDKPCFLIMGGIGVTPAISFLKTLRDLKDQRECILIYGNENYKNIPFRDDLEELKKEINLKITHVLTEPDDTWTGEEGMVTDELILEHLPEDKNSFDYYLCGPAGMMDVAEKTLRKAGISWKNIYAERFDLV